MAAQLTTVTVAFPAIPDTAKLLPHADKLLPHGLFPTIPKQPEATFFEGSSGSIFIGLCMLLAIATRGARWRDVRLYSLHTRTMGTEQCNTLPKKKNEGLWRAVNLFGGGGGAILGLVVL